MKKLLNLTLAAVLSMTALPMIAGKNPKDKAKDALDKPKMVYIQNTGDLTFNFEVRTRHKQKKGSRVRTAQYLIKPGQVIAHSYPADGKIVTIKDDTAYGQFGGHNKIGLHIIPGGDIPSNASYFRTGGAVPGVSEQNNSTISPLHKFVKQHQDDQQLYLQLAMIKRPSNLTLKILNITDAAEQAKMRAAASQVSGSVVEEDDANDDQD